MARCRRTIWLTRIGVTPMALASAYWLRPSGAIKSWSKISPGCTGGSFLVFISSVVVHNFNVVGAAFVPAEANPPLIIDADAVLPGTVPLEGFQAVARRQPQVAQLPRAMQLRELPQSDALNLRRQAVTALALPQTLCLPTGEAGNHRFNLSLRDNMSSGAVLRDVLKPTCPLPDR